MSFEKRIAIVTGGTGGIGTATCRLLTQHGVRVIATNHHHEKSCQWLNQQHQAGFEIDIMDVDVADFNSCNTLVNDVLRKYGKIDILINNAGMTADSTLRKMTLEQWESVIHTNLNSLFNMTKHVLPTMLDQNFGRIINISSINAQKGQFGQCNYAATKAGIHGFTKSLAQEVARKGITVNTISPGYIATEMVMKMKEDVREHIIANIPVGRLGKPEEIARLIAFLADDDSGFITGADFSANGGQFMF
ncbi:MAG: acetoacetyl-CoA reductase [Legionellales bacterium]|nr:acetoacetyl-CoA reductase [Legionellales bacterium]